MLWRVETMSMSMTNLSNSVSELEDDKLKLE